MKPQTLKALRGSIKKWEDIVNGTGIDKYADNCPLCARFHPMECVRPDGEECPVAAAGHWYCSRTPYADWCESITGRSSRKAKDDESVMCAVLELEFLKSLLPRREK